MTKFYLRSWEEEQATLTAFTCFVTVQDDPIQRAERHERTKLHRGDVAPVQDVNSEFTPSYDLSHVVSSFFDTLLDSFHTPSPSPPFSLVNAAQKPPPPSAGAAHRVSEGGKLP